LSYPRSNIECMSEVPRRVGVLPEVAALTAAVDGLLALDRSALTAAELLELVRGMEIQMRRMAAVDQANLAEVGARHLPGELGLRDVKALLIDQLRVDSIEAHHRAEAARDFGPRQALSGQALAPIFAPVADAIAAGQISMRHARVITTFFDKLPSQTATELFDVLQEQLLDNARRANPTQLAQLAVDLEAVLNPDGTEPADEAKKRQRGFTLATGADGWSTPTGLLSPRLTAVIEAVLDSLAAPKPSENGERDERCAAARRHDGLQDGLERVLRSRTLPTTGGAVATVLVKIDHKDLHEATGYGHTSHGHLIPTKDLLQLATDANIIAVILNDAGGIMNYGRGRRTASEGQRRALAVRDGGCSSPGCTAPPEWTQVHHLDRWEHGGQTNIDRMCLACAYHHAQLDHGWTITMIDGVPHWVAPQWIDPDQQPRRNTAHHTQIEFRQLRELHAPPEELDRMPE